MRGVCKSRSSKGLATFCFGKNVARLSASLPLARRTARAIREKIRESRMCGICGLLEFESKREVSPDLVRGISATLRHRGPDDEGMQVGPGIGFGFWML